MKPGPVHTASKWQAEDSNPGSLSLERTLARLCIVVQASKLTLPSLASTFLPAKAKKRLRHYGAGRGLGDPSGSLLFLSEVIGVQTGRRTCWKSHQQAAVTKLGLKWSHGSN